MRGRLPRFGTVLGLCSIAIWLRTPHALKCLEKNTQRDHPDSEKKSTQRPGCQKANIPFCSVCAAVCRSWLWALVLHVMMRCVLPSAESVRMARQPKVVGECRLAVCAVDSIAIAASAIAQDSLCDRSREKLSPTAVSRLERNGVFRPAEPVAASDQSIPGAPPPVALVAQKAHCPWNEVEAFPAGRRLQFSSDQPRKYRSVSHIRVAPEFSRRQLC